MQRLSFALGVLAALDVLVAASAPGVLAAQATDAPRTRPAAGVALGGDVSNVHGNGSPDYYGQVGVEWRRRPGGLGLRADLVYFQRSESTRPVYCDAGCVASVRNDQYGLTLSATYQFLSRLPVRPYLLTGVGVYGARERRSFEAPTNPCDPRTEICLASGVAGAYTTRMYGLGMHAGGGLTFDIGRVHLFTEATLHEVDWGSRGPYTGMRIPIAIGVRF
jgi:hypothetical protein